MKNLITFEEFLNESKAGEFKLGDSVVITNKKYAAAKKVTAGEIVEIHPGGMLTIDTTRGKMQLHPDMVKLEWDKK